MRECVVESQHPQECHDPSRAIRVCIPLFALARADNPEIAALHPVSAFVAFALSITVARNSLAAVRMTDGEPVSVSEAAAA